MKKLKTQKCKQCGCEITKERLEIFPDVEYCVDCAEELAPPETKAEFKYDSDGSRPRHW